MKLDKYIKLTDEDVEFLTDLDTNDFSDWTNEELVNQLRKLARQVVVVRPTEES